MRITRPITKLLLGTTFSILSSGALQASPSTYSGPVVQVKSQPSPSTTGNVRVSIEVQTSPNSPCTGFSGIWYSYDLPDGAVAKMWGATLLSALASGRSVAIVGTGTCDAYNIEVVSYIAAL
jgi:hypothetical protein